MDKEELKQIYASIHTLRMEGDLHAHGVSRFSVRISIHTLRVEGDIRQGPVTWTYPIFQSTPSAWRVTAVFAKQIWVHFTFQSTPSAWRVTYEWHVNR